jgi:hypothetical protein
MIGRIRRAGALALVNIAELDGNLEHFAAAGRLFVFADPGWTRSPGSCPCRHEPCGLRRILPGTEDARAACARAGSRHGRSLTSGWHRHSGSGTRSRGGPRRQLMSNSLPSGSFIPTA